MPERSSGGIAGDLLAISWQVALAVGVPLFVAAWLSQQVTQNTGIQLAIVLAGLAIAGAGMYVIIRRYIALNPVPPTSDAAREAGRAWEREIVEQERKKEADRER
ncbi:MAG: hypothetical protein M3O88_09900 [Actinomycetota bacterium]|nr:hypothetical protein [Actinomycetota bacterium]